MYQIGIDIGGTFTDAVLVDDDTGQVWTAKVPTTPKSLEQCFFDAMDTVRRRPTDDERSPVEEIAHIVHGTTVATNIVVERRGSLTGLLTTKGFGDTLHIMQGHGYTAGIPDEQMMRIHEIEKPTPLVPKRLVREINERIDTKGDVVVPLDEAAVRTAVEELLRAGVEAFAICFLWSFMNDDHERRAEAIVRELAPEAYVTRSSAISPRLGEYSRTVTAAINAYVGPKTSKYIRVLERRLQDERPDASLSILQCSGGVVSPVEAVRSPIRLIGSGPVGGAIASQMLGQHLGYGDLINADMGGTTFDVSVVSGGVPVKSPTSVVNQYEYAVPTVDIRSIGSGGGSIVSVDRSGALRVGPESAGADPGPACYGSGGTRPTITDCDLAVGYLNSANFLGGKITLDHELAEEAIRRHVADPLGMSVPEAAHGALRVVDLQMADLMRQMTVERGLDPRDFVVFAFGGAGPTHAPVYAAELGVRRVVVPRGEVASVWSAFGAVSGDVLLPLEQTLNRREPFDAEEVEAAFQRLEAQGRDGMAAMGVEQDRIEFRRYMDLKYGKQVHVVGIETPSKLNSEIMPAVLDAFDSKYEDLYGTGTAYRGAGIELSSVRVEVISQRGVTIPGSKTKPDPVAIDLGELPRRSIYWNGQRSDTPVVLPEILTPGVEVVGPAIVELPFTTIPVHAGQTMTVDSTGSLLLYV